MILVGLNTQLITLLLIVSTLWLIILTLIFLRSEGRWRKLSAGITQGDLRSLLEKLERDQRLNTKEIAAVSGALTDFKADALSHLQRVGFIRYNPFSDTGGDQSFCLALLDGQGSGIVLSSLHSREQTRIYAKPIRRGKSIGYTLSKEERVVIQNATQTQ